ncbi:MAG: acyl-CoA dehydrogenase family protein [Gemmatimonadetes bacterium]|nr:acyl-CoA dehydrogenase family protein [Gemmatimonadota bacterium]
MKEGPLALDLPREVEALREEVRAFARERIAPVATEADRTAAFPHENVRAMAERGWFGIPLPREYGGLGMSSLAFIVALEELARVDASHAITVGAHTSLGAAPIATFGTERQKRAFLPEIAAGRKLAGFGLTEPQAGSDAGGTRTRAVEDGDEFVLNGTKVFITNGGVGETFVVTAVTEPGRGSSGVSAFVIEKGTPGFRAGKKEDKLGWRASDTSELVFEDARVPRENLLGARGAGFRQFLGVLDGGRIGIGAFSLGLAVGAYEASLRYALVREQFGRPIAEFQGVSFPLADMALRIEAGRHLTYHAARLKDAGRPFGREAAMAKLFCSELAMWATTQAVQLHGANGYTSRYPVERMMRDAKICEIGEGTSEIQRVVISRGELRRAADVPQTA